MSDDKLKPCPGCGESEDCECFGDGRYYVMCKECRWKGPERNYSSDADAAWNARVAIAPPALLSRALRAICLTRDYVGEGMLPAIAGWEWYDAGKAIAEYVPDDPWAKEFWARVAVKRKDVAPEPQTHTAPAAKQCPDCGPEPVPGCVLCQATGRHTAPPADEPEPQAHTPAVATDDEGLPIVAGDNVDRSLNALERGALVCMKEEYEKLLPDNALIAVLCDTVRLIREHVRMAKSGLVPPADDVADFVAAWDAYDDTHIETVDKKEYAAVVQARERSCTDCLNRIVCDIAARVDQCAKLRTDDLRIADRRAEALAAACREWRGMEGKADE